MLETDNISQCTYQHRFLALYIYICVYMHNSHDNLLAFRRLKLKLLGARFFFFRTTKKIQIQRKKCYHCMHNMNTFSVAHTILQSNVNVLLFLLIISWKMSYKHIFV